MTPPPDPTPGDALRTARIIAAAMAAGVTVFAFVAWVVRGNPPLDDTTGSATLITSGWIVIATTILVGAVLFWRGRVAPLLERPPGGYREESQSREVLTALVIAWALIETAALPGVVVYFLFGHAWPAALAVATMWLGLGFTWPRARWFGLV